MTKMCTPWERFSLPIQMPQEMIELKLRAVPDNVPQAIDCVGETARKAGFTEHAVRQIQVAVDEACANVVQHAYEGQPPGDMAVTCLVQDDSFTVRVRDWGRGFHPDQVPNPDLTAPLEERHLGGLGLYLIRQFMDEAYFVYDPDHGNELVMIKHRHPHPRHHSHR